MSVSDMQTNGGDFGAGGGKRRLARWLLAGFLVIFVVQGYANVGSMVADLARNGVEIPVSRVWIWESTSLIMWLSLLPVIWWGVARIRPPRFAWWQVAVLFLIGSVVVSAVHIGGMVALRVAIYAAAFGERYDFGNWLREVGYEYRKDFATYLLFAAIAALAQWLLQSAGDSRAQPSDPAAVLVIVDGAVSHRIPVGEIDWVVAAGNYVELVWRGRTLLHRATLAAAESDLGTVFVRIHRSRLVRRDAVRRIATDKSGDFVVTLDSGASLRGSRRFRTNLQQD